MGSDAPEFSIKQIADLSKLSFDEAKSAELAPQFREMLELADSLAALELENVSPYFGEVQHVESLRRDEVQMGLNRESALKNAPDTDGEHYRVPKVFE